MREEAVRHIFYVSSERLWEGITFRLRKADSSFFPFCVPGIAVSGDGLLRLMYCCRHFVIVVLFRVPALLANVCVLCWCCICGHGGFR